MNEDLKDRIRAFFKFYTSRPFTPMKIIGLALIVILFLLLLFSILYLLDIITPLSIASFVINIIGEDVEVTEINDEVSYTDVFGLKIANDSWAIAQEETNIVFINSGSAHISISYIAKGLEESSDHISGKLNEMTEQLSSAGAPYFTQESKVSGHDAFSIISESPESKFMMTIWYCDIQEKIYFVNSIYGDRNDVLTFMERVHCHLEEA